MNFINEADSLLKLPTFIVQSKFAASKSIIQLLYRNINYILLSFKLNINNENQQPLLKLTAILGI